MANPPEFDSLIQKNAISGQFQTYLLGCGSIFSESRVLARLLLFETFARKHQ